MKFLELYGKSMLSFASVMKHHPLTMEKDKIQWGPTLETDHRWVAVDILDLRTY